jgi:hypothetical protein
MGEQTPTGVKYTSSDISGTTTMFYDEIVYDQALTLEVIAAQRVNPKAKRCQCANSDCRAITKGGSFAPGHDAKMVKRLAEQVLAKSGPFAQFSMADARRNLYAAGGSDALMNKLAAKVARSEGRLTGVAISKPIRIAVRMSITVTPEQAEGLAVEYGMETDPAALREFVRSEIRGLADHEQSGHYAAQFWTLEDE